jgi:photosystem II stability/assembly factor-like uncharacterized protein
MSLRAALLSITASIVLATACDAGAAPGAPGSAGDPSAGLAWRLVGPFRAGWSTMAVGVPAEPDTFYFGAAGGGVWKSIDAGATWHPASEGLRSAPIGAIAVAPSQPRTLYAGTGQPEPRYDIAAGDGMYRSDDGAAHWRPIGLEGTRHIGAILVDPARPDTVLVAALGHVFGPDDERGVFRSDDGGRHWTRTLFVDGQTGAVDLARDPAQPDLVFAATWTARNWPWLSYFTPIAGAGSAIHVSRDGGRTWQRLGGEGWPDGPLGRIGLAVAHPPDGGTRLYASVDSDEHGGLYRSDDGGAHWRKVNDATAVSTWYMSRLTVAPDDPDTLYTVGQSIHRSTDGGRTFAILKGAPGGDDYHYLWIDRRDPRRMVAASDQGTVVSVDGGASWSDWYNQPTGQFYHLAADDSFPYRIYSGQQDSGTVRIASRSDYGAISFRDWTPVGGDERDYDLPHPGDPDVVFGSGLGGRLSRWDARTGEVQNVSPWPVSSYGARATDVRYRYTWISPIAFSRQAPWALYAGAQVLFRSTDQGRTWATISPDLTGAEPGAKDCGGDVPVARATACGYGVIYAIAPSPRDPSEIWIGTDNGRVQLTRDGGAHWSDVTPGTVPDWAKIATLDVGALDAGTAYIAVDNHRQDDFRPRILRTHDHGQSWKEINGGLPDGHFVDVVRADPVRRGLLYAGTDVGVYVSFDDGDHWQPLQANLPVAWVRDLLVHGNDLIAATQGRALWVLDDISPLRQYDPRAGTRLYAPAAAVRVPANRNRDTPLPADTPLGTNPPAGAIIDYTLARPARRVVIDVLDAGGTRLRRFDSADTAPTPAAETYFADAWLKAPARPGTGAGAHRFVWDLRLARPDAAAYGWSIAATLQGGTPLLPEGMQVGPGDYTVVLDADGRQWRQPLRILPDPRVPLDADGLAQALAFWRSIEPELARDARAHRELEAVKARVAALLGDAATPADLRNALATFAQALAPLRKAEGEQAPNLAAIGDVLANLASDVEASDRAPTAAQRAVLSAQRARLDDALAQWRQRRDTDLPALNARLRRAGIAAVRVDAPATPGEGASRDLP